MRRIVRENGLTLALLGLFLISIGGQSLAGWRMYSEEKREHGEGAVGYVAYLGTGAFVESVFENRESEFLQMGVYVLLTAFLYQKGSAESRTLDDENPQDEDPRHATARPDVPAPARYGGVLGAAYGHSLTIAMLALVVLGVVLRQRGSPQFGPVAAPHAETGTA